MEPSPLPAAPPLSRWLRVALLTFPGDVDSDQPVPVFISARRAQGDATFALPPRRRPGDHLKRRLFRSPSAPHSFPRLSNVAKQHPARVHRSCLLSTHTEA